MENVTDKSKQVGVSLSLVNNKLNFIGKTDFETSVSIDYIPPYGDNLGYTSLELLLMSLASCYGSALLLLLRRMGKIIKGLELKADGVRREQHPTSFRTITLDFCIKSDNTTEQEVEKVMKLSEDSLCPVYAMLKGNVEISTRFSIVKD